MRLIAYELEGFRHEGHLHVPDVLPEIILDRVRRWATEIERRGEGSALHFEASEPNGMHRAWCEDFTPEHQGLERLATQGLLPVLASQLLGEQAVLARDRLLVRHPGDMGAPDDPIATAPLPQREVSCMIPLDSDRSADGSWSVASGLHIPSLSSVARRLGPAPGHESAAWRVSPTSSGDLLWVHARTPIRSTVPPGSPQRRTLVFTYRPVSAGDFRRSYYDDLRRSMGLAAG